MTPRFWDIFFEVYEPLPRQGPGNRESAAKALAYCKALPPSPTLLDIGCGVGGQTLYLADLINGSILALDNHAPFIERLNNRLAERGLAHRVRAVLGDMTDPKLEPASFDLIWSEGALYSIGLEKALGVCRRLLRPGGYLVFTEAVWRKENPPPEVKESFDLDYPTMGRTEDVVTRIAAAELELLAHFTLPDEAWWTDFYTPMQHRIEELRGQYLEDEEATAILDELAREPEMHRKHSKYYAYEYFITRR
jgi:SAM-dependent methyltransferase